jgi:cytochrome c
MAWARPAAAVPAGDPDAGKALFRAKCTACHSTLPGNNRNRPGPTLFGLLGRKSASVSHFPYSPANQSSHKVWDKATLDQYLEDPRSVIPGTKMAFDGIADPADRANIIAYIETLK